MLHNPFSTPMPATRPSLQLPGTSPSSRPSSYGEPFSDARTHGHCGSSRSVTLQNASSPGGSAISKSQDGERCVVAGKESLRILRVSEPSEKASAEHKFAVGKGGHRIDASRNLWSGSGLKVDSAMTDVVWCHKAFDTKILTSARNGELIMWDLNKSGSSKYERRIKGHMRSINKLSYSHVMPYYCSTGSSDGNLRVWDLRDLTKASHYIHHTFGIRTVMFSPSVSDPLHAITGLDNGTMCRWDLRMGQKGQLERVPLAHTGPILSLDWCDPRGIAGGWLASAGLDRTVKVWDFSENTSYSSTRKPAYVLHTSYPVRRAMWRPGFETELAVASNNESGFNFSSKSSPSSSVTVPSLLNSEIAEAMFGQIIAGGSNANVACPNSGGDESVLSAARNVTAKSGDLIEVWDVRRAWIAKWTVDDSSCEGGVSDMTFADSHALWVQHPSGAFSQMDMQYCDKPIDSVPRAALTWTPTGSLTFVNDSKVRWEVPYDDIAPVSKLSISSEKIEPHKKLGDAPYVPTTQCVGTMCEENETEEWGIFDFLARAYRIEGADQITLCELNAEYAFEAGNTDAGRIWMLLHSQLMDIVKSKPPTPPLSPKTIAPTLPHSVSAPAGVPSLKKSLAKYPSTTSSSDPPKSALKTSSSRDEEERFERPTPKGIVITPSTRSTVSPAMSQSVGHENGKRSASQDRLQQRRQSVNVATLARARRHSNRRSSTSMTSHNGDKSSSSRTRRLHQVGEGALDSDSSEGTSTRASSIERQKDNTKVEGSAESLNSPGTGSLKAPQVPQRHVSSPVLREDNDWAEDEAEDSDLPDSSSDAESDSSVASTTAERSSSVKRSMRGHASRSANSIHRDLPRTDSHSSVLTVTAGGDKPYSHDPPALSEIVADRASLVQSHKSRRRRSQVLSVSSVHPHYEEPDVVDEDEMRFLEWNHIAIRETEERYRRTAWNALKVLLEDLAENGDVQMCAMLACIAPRELGIEPSRALQFIEAYIDILSRLRMHGVAAYIRKHAPSSEVNQSTQVQTTIYSLCASCRKPIMQPAHGSGGRLLAGFSHCPECKKAAIKCTICHLPVRSALFVCAVCSHGGHRECYHRYYMQRPMVELLTSTPESRGRRITRLATPPSGDIDENVPTVGFAPSESGDNSTITVMGHPCAAGCGHFCWAASEKSFPAQSGS